MNDRGNPAGDFGSCSASRARVGVVISPRFVLLTRSLDVLAFPVRGYGIAAMGSYLTTPIYNLVSRPPVRTLIVGASKRAVAGFGAKPGVWWRYDLMDDYLIGGFRR